MSSPANALVTGATSQIGTFLLPRLSTAGFSVTAISRQSIESSAAAQVSWLATDIATQSGAVLPAADVLIHLAPLHLLPALLSIFFRQGGRRVICFGTTSRHAKATSADPHEQAFAARQAGAEAKVAELCAAAGAHWTIFRPTLIYGCGIDRNVSLIARAIRRFGFFPLLGSAAGLRQPVHADDLAAACVAAIDNAASFDKAYDLSGGETLSYRAMVERIFAALGRRPRFVRVPIGAFSVTMGVLSLLPRFRDFNAEMARRMNEDLVFDASAAQRDFGYAPRPFQPVFTISNNDAVRV